MEPAETYLKRHHLLAYVEDAVCLLLACREDDPRTKPFHLLAGYFKKVRDGTHVVFRQYSFTSATPLNRKSFVSLLWRTYGNVPEVKEPMRLLELHSLLRLLCSDFPLTETEKATMILQRQSAPSDRVSFTDFIYTFQVTFYLDRFLCHLKSMLPGLLAGAYVPPIYPQFTTVVPLPIGDTSLSNLTETSRTSSVTDPSETIRTCYRPISGGVFLEAVLGLGQRMMEREVGQSCLSSEALREVLEGVERVSYSEFVVKLSFSETLIRDIGVLPSRR